MTRRWGIAGLAGTALVLAGAGAWLLRTHPRAVPVPASRTPLYWYDPMRPAEHFQQPGRSPFMDMDLLPKYADEATPGKAGSSAVIAVDSRTVAALGVRFAKAERRDIARVVRTVGVVGVDEHGIQVVQVRAPGWVEGLEVRAVGDPVRRGQRLAAVYSPDLLAAQEELLIARQAGDASLLAAARRRLALFGLSAPQIARIESSGQAERRIDYYAPFDGYVLELGGRPGAAVQPGTTRFQLADLSRVWVMAEGAEAQGDWIALGDRARVSVASLPGRQFAGRVDYLYPQLASDTRTLKVRLVLDNPRRLLRPGMFADVHLQGAMLHAVLSVPTEAIIQTGVRSLVIVADDGEHFRPVEVRVGTEFEGHSAILGGLNGGENVVSSGQFLIDSEANLRSAFDRLAGAQP